jgi:hypothetical protein
MLRWVREAQDLEMQDTGEEDTTWSVEGYATGARMGNVGK